VIQASDLHLMPKFKTASRYTGPIRLQVTLHKYVNVEAPRNLCTKTGYDLCKLFAACSLAKAAAAAVGQVVMTDGHGALFDGN
jgi:hypothetical protein